MKKIFILPVLLFCVSCSMNSLAVKAASKTLDRGMQSVFKEKDLDYSRQALPANLKLIEILLENSMDEKLLENASLGFCGYAWAFLEDSSPAQAESFYKKGIFYSSVLMEKKKISRNGKINARAVTKKNSPALFWNTFCKSALINFDPSNSENSVMLGETQQQAEILAQKDPAYLNNAIYAVLGSIYASKPRMFGGDTQKSQYFFEKALSGNGASFLLNKYMYAKTYAVAVQDEELFIKTLESVINTENADENISFFNEVAREKALKLKEKKNEYF